MYICSKCGRTHSLEEFRKSRFCRHCGKFLTPGNRRTLERPLTKRRIRIELESKVEKSTERTYRSIQGNLPPSTVIDSLEVVKQVEQYRQFWRPKRTNVVLLAESHVYTDETDFEMTCDKSLLREIVPSYPFRFVRFVYCLGYGENELLNRVRTDRKNAGTPQYWKIFSSCVAKDEDDLGFAKTLKTGTPSFTRRLRNKVDVLRKMRKKGVWLLDASIVGLYGSGKKDYATMEKILRICWQNYIGDVISASSPKHIVVIGKGVGRILDRSLRDSGIPSTVIPQPQARGSSEWQLENYKKYQRVCARFP